MRGPFLFLPIQAHDGQDPVNFRVRKPPQHAADLKVFICGEIAIIRGVLNQGTHLLQDGDAAAVIQLCSANADTPAVPAD